MLLLVFVSDCLLFASLTNEGGFFRRRVPNELTLATQLIAWERPHNDAQVKIRWKFSTQVARRVFAQYYSASSNC
jgi:hypothetical protein